MTTALRRSLLIMIALTMINSFLIMTIRPAGAEPERGLEWVDCADGLQCATMPAPLDWRHPDGPSTPIELGRLPALDQAAKRGTLLVVTGGPAPTLPVLRAVPELFADLRKSYDLVGVDPRGIGEQHHYACPNGIGTSAFASDLSRAAWQRFAERNAAWDAACRRDTDPVVDHLNAWQVAHDLEAVRVALDLPDLTYYGNSYGTVYGQAYAELFPRTVGRMVLDSVVDHTRTGLAALSKERALRIEQAFADHARWCATTSTCALHGRDVRLAWDALMAKAAEHPVPAPSAGPGVTVTADEIRLFTVLSVDQLPGSPSWSALAEAIVAAEHGDAAAFRYDDSPHDVVINRYANCADFPLPQTYDDYRAAERRLRAVAPRLGWLQPRLDFARCVGLTIIDPYRPHRLRAPGLPPVLLLGGTADSATPVADGRRVARQLPGSGFVTAVGSYHGVYLRGNRCARDQVHRYLATGKVPARSLTCPAEPGAG
ncbi:alpha/beta hydrolase [Microlunatus parietis]|uniref:Pimeloyl-ACP methyl ester carboxylesterase n=1 Tax=Microlunatus parietis TaxID=682979 RepID=A0A7Y9I973_9ACTN|nr:alpha/beta hydrolase [Microlunatus parietis]NYE72338.1 pimeloyl-ACP methyl ester carboxylesterase [Microlunatus parietis]